MESLLTHAPATERQRLPKATAVSDATGLRSWKLKRGITIRERNNGPGSISFRLEIPAKVAGSRRIIQFKYYEDAEREAERALANKEHFGRSGFLLSKAQMDDALRAMGLLSEFNVSLTEAAEYLGGMNGWRGSGGSATVKAARKPEWQPCLPAQAALGWQL